MLIKERNAKFYTEEGINSLENRIKTLIKIFNKGDFPIETYLFGFGELKINSKTECFNRIKELADIIGVEFRFTEEKIKMNDGSKIIKEVINF